MTKQLPADIKPGRLSSPEIEANFSEKEDWTTHPNNPMRIK
jgi:hypothetical protein